MLLVATVYTLISFPHTACSNTHQTIIKRLLAKWDKWQMAISVVPVLLRNAMELDDVQGQYRPSNYHRLPHFQAIDASIDVDGVGGENLLWAPIPSNAGCCSMHMTTRTGHEFTV